MDIRKAFVQQKNGDWINETAFTMAEGCRLQGIEVVPFIADTIDVIDIERETIVHGWVGVVHKALARLGVRQPHVDSAPAELMPYFGRKIWTSTMEEVRNSERGYHIKPKFEHKLFDGHVATEAFSDLIRTAHVPDDTYVLCSEAVRFVTEYRVFVDQGKIVGAKHYLGDYTKIVNFDVAKRAVASFNAAPAAYSIDLGLLDNGQTSIVEVNDAYALGGYGLAPVTYARMVEHRWVEMVTS